MAKNFLCENTTQRHENTKFSQRLKNLLVETKLNHEKVNNKKRSIGRFYLFCVSILQKLSNPAELRHIPPETM